MSSAWRDLPVIARNSSFVYKGHPVDVKQVSRELDVRYVDRFEFMGEILPGAVGPDRRVRVVYERDSRAYEAELRVGSFAIFWPRLFSSAAVIFCGLLLIRSAPPSPLVSALFQTSLVIGITMGITHCGARAQTLAAIGTHIAVYTVGWPIVLRAFQLFPQWPTTARSAGEAVALALPLGRPPRGQRCARLGHPH